MRDIILSNGLSVTQLQDIRELENACCKTQELNMKLNWDMLEKRPANQINDLMYYEDNNLIGYLGIYDMDQTAQKIEITGMVHPNYRRLGIFTELFKSGLLQCKSRGAKKLLFISERASEAGISFLQKNNSQYSFSEFRMIFRETEVPDFPYSGIILKKAQVEDYPKLMSFDRLCFGLTEDQMDDKYIEYCYSSTFIAELDNKVIGKIGISMDGESGYIFGFCISPEYRNKGYGREVLASSLANFLFMQVKTVILEVAVANDKALNLYKSCGFKELTVYDYYEYELD